MSNIPQAARQSAIWLPDVLEDEPDDAEDVGVHQHEYVPQHQRMTMGGRRSTRDLANLPPQLRASVFFDLPEPAQQVELKEQSAVATLDSILDASASAPVSAFTDHAYAGALGAEVYGKPKVKRASRSSMQMLEPPTSSSKKRTSSFNLLRRRSASSNDLLEAENKEKKRASTLSGDANRIRAVIDEDENGTKDTDPLTSDNDPTSRVASGEFGPDPEEEASEHSEEEDEDDQYHGPPTTLLAELQLRKQQQKQRTKQTFPNGMHSTLLQLDAVAQVEQKSRKKKKITLAWEDPATYNQPDEEDDDEHVPLALLYSKKAAETNRPLGLMERREMEDNEPLSKRRDRLQGRPPRAKNATMLDGIPTTEDPEEEDGETLAQRSRRLKDQSGGATHLPAARTVSGDFTSEIMSQFGGEVLDKGKGKVKEVPSEEETLGQRRKRLQTEREARKREFGSQNLVETQPPLNNRRSMADILQAHPQANSHTRAPSYEKPVGGLLGLHEQAKQKRPSLEGRRSSTRLNLESTHVPQIRARAPAGGFNSGMYNDGQGGISLPQLQPHPQANIYPQFAQPSLAGFGGNGFGTQQTMTAYQNPYIYNPNPLGVHNMATGMGMNVYNPMIMGPAMAEPLNQGQIDMVERWRQSVMQ